LADAKGISLLRTKETGYKSFGGGAGGRREKRGTPLRKRIPWGKNQGVGRGELGEKRSKGEKKE